MTTTVAGVSLRCITLFIFISIYMNTVQAIVHQKLPAAELKEFVQSCQNEQLLSSMQTNIKTTLQNITQDLFNNLSQCGDGLWKRIAYVNMSDGSNQCPPNWTGYLSPGNIRSCGRPKAVRSGASCTSVYFSSSNYEYHHVCGRATGYQNSSTDAFGWRSAYTINNAYVDGLSLTYGRERTHIWTFAAGNSETNTAPSACYCGDSTTHGMRPQMYVGRNFFCESAVNNNTFAELNTFYTQDPLWDGQDCPHSNCCTFNSPPWFSRELPTSTTDDVEARICLDEGLANEDLTIALLEIYVQ